jgi:hypothetical protein
MNYCFCAAKVFGIKIAQSTVSIYMVPRPDRPLQSWKTFLRNHMEGIAAIDLFVVPTIAFEQLFAFLVLGHCRRQLLWIAVTRNPTAECWHGKSLKRFRGIRRRNISSATMTEHLALCSRLPCGQWASAISAHLFPLALAERIYRTLDRVDPTRVHGSFDCVQRRAPSANSCEIRRLL